MARRFNVMLLVRRLVLTVPILFGVATMTFFVTRVAGGDPAYLIAGPFPTKSNIAHIRAELGENHPLIVQYVNYLGNLIHLRLGTSLSTGDPVVTDLRQRLPVTLELVVLSLIVATVLGILAGSYAAHRRGRKGDVAVQAGSFLMLSLPDFWVGLMLLYVFFFKLGWAPPPVGQLTPGGVAPRTITHAAFLDSILTGNLRALGAAAGHLVLPVLTFGLVFAAPIARLTRSAVLEILESDYVRFARSCGLSTFALWRYVQRAALPPVITLVGILFSALIGGAVLIETVFAWGGAAQWAAQAIGQNDYPAIQAFVLVAGVISVGVFFVVDILYMVIDPRVSVGTQGMNPIRALANVPGSVARMVVAANSMPRRVLRPVRASGGRPAPLAGARMPRGSERDRVAGRRFAMAVTRLRSAASGDGRSPRARVRATVAHVRATRWHPTLIVGVAIVAILIAAAFIVPALSHIGPQTANPVAALQGPSLRHPFGTDESGLDVFTRVFYAPRIDFPLAAAGVGVGLGVGVLLGLIAGWSRGLVGEVIMRITDLLQAFPLFILALALVALTGNKLTNVVWALGFVNAPVFLRLIRSRVLTIREQRYVRAAVALGNSRTRLVARHVLPNAVGPVIVQAGISMGYAILILAGLAFLGVGVQVPTPEWGSMILIGSANITTGQWWTAVFPGVALSIAVLGFNLISEGIERTRATV